MTKTMLIDATHPEETRAVVLDGRHLADFDFETSTKRQLKGNIYLAKITRVEPSLQAAFVEYGGNRHGFLAFSEIHPDYYQVPQADRAMLEEIEREAAAKAAADSEAEGTAAAGNGETEVIDGDSAEADADEETADAARRAGPPARPAAAQLQDPGGDQAPADHAGAGRQGGARQQGRRAHHLPLARRPLLRADAQHAARRRHQPQDRRTPTTAAGSRRSPQELEVPQGHGPDHPHRRPGAQQGRDPARLRVSAAPVERDPRDHAAEHRAQADLRGRRPHQAGDARPLHARHRGGAGRGRGGLQARPSG